MGLAGRKAKQKIQNDPRNLSWADDAARFGSNYLSKFGWDSSKGLGVGGDGRTSHVKVVHKLDMLGIGAAHQADPNGIAWKQNKDFESLLKRLNEANENENEDGKEREEEPVFDGFVKPKEDSGEDYKDGKNEEERKRKKKRKREDSPREEKQKRRKNEDDVEEKSAKKQTNESPGPTPAGQKEPARVVPRHRSHRARHIAAKSLASKSAAAISEILGIAPTTSAPSSSTPSGTQEGTLAPPYDDKQITETDKITTSAKSLQDYFKEKIDSLKRATTRPDAIQDLPSETTAVDPDDIPRGGLGSRPKQISEEDHVPKLGLTKLSMLTSSSFMHLSSLFSPAETRKEDGVEEEEERDARALKKEHKRQEKEERRRQKREKRLR